MSGLALFISVFLACTVEAVEATTIVLAAGTAKDWRSALSGTFAGLGVLAVIIAAIGPAISKLPIGDLRLFVGGLLLVFGLQWVRKAILRSSGYKALHNEDAIFQEELFAARSAKGGGRLGVSDWYAFTLSFKGVLLEGLEVAFIVLTFGTIQHQIALASLAAFIAVVMVAFGGFAVRKPLARVPENTMKFVVGIMLTSFGIFWGAEGAGASWPGKDISLPLIVVFMTLLSLGLVRILKMRYQRHLVAVSGQVDLKTVVVEEVIADEIEEDKLEILESRTFLGSLKAFGDFWYDFLIGDDWRGTVGLVVAFILTGWLNRSGATSWWILPTAVMVLMPYNLARVTKAR
ncbi:MAG TPA: hypothetical protein VF307_03800 [Candidatus Nanopelagicaceae bacterium]